MEMQNEKRKVELRFFDDLALFSKAVEEAGFTFDFSSVTQLNTIFLKSSEKYLVLNIKDYEVENPNNLLFLDEEKALLFSKKPPTSEEFKEFEKIFSKPYGTSTVLAFLTSNKALTSYKTRLEILINETKQLEQTFNVKKYRELVLEFERLIDLVEDFHDMVMRLEERHIKEVETRYISFDYSVLIAESNGLLDRCRRRFYMLRDIARDNELQTATDLNRRIERLNEVVKRLTALTVILMIPTVIASHFGMNFLYMPELKEPWAYPMVIVVQAIITIIAIIVFRKIKWL